MIKVKEVTESEYVQAQCMEKVTFVDDFYFKVSVICDVIKLTFLIPWLYVKEILKFLFCTKTSKCVKGKLVLITGGGNGLGRGLAIRLASLGCDIAILDIDHLASKKTENEIIEKYDVKCKAYHCDVADYAAVESCREMILKDLGIVKILINNAGIVPYQSLRENDWSSYDRILRVNIHSYILVTKIFIEDMIKEKDGHIVGISSMGGLLPASNFITYCTTKFANVGFMRSLTEELILHGYDFIKTSCVYPYFINTRRDTLEIVPLRFPPLDVEYVVNQTVDGILKNKENIYPIRYYWVIALAQKCLSTKAFRLCTKYIFKADQHRENYKTK